MESVEGLYASRGLMYSTVYLHHTARIAEAVLLRAMAKALPDFQRRVQLLEHDDETCIQILGNHLPTKKTLERLKYRRFLKRCDVVGMHKFKSKDWCLIDLKPGDPEYPPEIRGAITQKLDLLCGTLKEDYRYPVLLNSGRDVPLIRVSALVFSILMYEKTFRPKLIVATNESSKGDVKNTFRALLASRFGLEVSDD